MDTHGSKPKPHRQHTLLFPSPLTPGGHLQILISADLSKLQHRPNFNNRAKWSSCEWLHKRWTKYEKIDILISLCLAKQELYLITFILQLRCPFWKASVFHCHHTNSWNDQNKSYYTEYRRIWVWGDLAGINKSDLDKMRKITYSQPRHQWCLMKMICYSGNQCAESTLLGLLRISDS